MEYFRGFLSKTDIKPAPKPLTKLEKVTIYLKNYSTNASANGTLYLSEQRSLAEKIFWAVCLIISFSIGIYMFVEIVSKFDNKPVLVTYGTKETPIYMIPFPAVTICNEDPISTEFNYTKLRDSYDTNATQINQYLMKKLEYLQVFCDRDVKIQSNDYFKEDFYRVIKQISPSFSETFILCKLFGEEHKCNKLYYPTITPQGICYTFNLIEKPKMFQDKTYFADPFFITDYFVKGWDIKTNTYPTSAFDVYPKRALQSGIIRSLEVDLISFIDESDYRCKKFTQRGFRVQLHSPSDIPHSTRQYFRVPINTIVNVVVLPTLEIASKQVSQFVPLKRKCYFQGEKYLRYFKTYTKENCILECNANWTRKYCGCVLFSMPRDLNVRICGVGKLECLKEAKDAMLTRELTEFTGPEDDLNYHCGCLPLCNRLQYSQITSSAPWNYEDYIQRSIEKFPFLNQSGVSVSQLHIYFNNEQFLGVERHQLFRTEDFIASFGGLLGLFVGVSFISFVELIYYFTIRLFYKNKPEFQEHMDAMS